MEIKEFSHDDLKTLYGLEIRTLKDAVAKIEDQFKSKGQVVCQVILNGTPLSASEESQAADILISDIQSVGVRLNLLQDVIADSKINVVHLIRVAQKNALLLAESLKERKAHLGHSDYFKYLVEIEEIMDGLKALRPHLLTEGAPQNSQLRWQNAEQKLVKGLKEFVSAIEGKDILLVCDILEYEIEGSLGVWCDLLLSHD